MALPPAQPIVELWKYKEFSALGSKDVDDNDPHHPPLLLNRRDNLLKLCHRDVTDKEIARLRNASLTKKELFNSKVLSEVEQNFIQWSQINREPAFKKHRGDSCGSRSFADSKKDSS